MGNLLLNNLPQVRMVSAEQFDNAINIIHSHRLSYSQGMFLLTLNPDGSQVLVKYVHVVIPTNGFQYIHEVLVSLIAELYN